MRSLLSPIANKEDPHTSQDVHWGNFSMLKPFVLLHSLSGSHKNFPVPDWELSWSCPGPPAWGWIVHGIWTGEGYLALLPSPTHLGCSEMDDDVPEGKTCGLLNSH